MSKRDPEPPPDLVGEAIEESFPARDPPAWAGRGAVREKMGSRRSPSRNPNASFSPGRT